MQTLVRTLRDQGSLWPAWAILIPLSLALPILGTAIPLIERQMIDSVMVARRLDLLGQAVLVYGVVWLVATAISVGGGASLTYVTERVGIALRRRLFAQSATLSLVYSQREHSGRTMSLFANDVPALTALVPRTLIQALTSLTALAAGGLVMIALSWQLALAGAIAPPIVAGVAMILTRPLRPASRRIQDKLAEVTERIQENLAGTRELIAFGREREEQFRFGATLRDLLRLRMRLTLMESGVQAGQSVFSLAVTLVILGYGAYLVVAGETTLGTVVAIRSLFGLVLGPAGRLFGFVADTQKGLAAADRIYEFLDEAPRVRETTTARPPANVRGEIAFDHVGFSYRPGLPVLRDVSFTMRPGERVAIVGPSGAGKSTLVSLVARFYDPLEGAVRLDGVDLRELTLAGLRSRIGIVFQNTFLFSDTIRANIAFGREGASEREVSAAAEAANAWEFIAELPDGLGTQVGERGVLLSEGQKQRIAIARALLRDPRILILDEPTSALDARTEHLLRPALGNLMRDRTTFVIAHRLGTVVGADRILVLEGGRLVQQGTHGELVAGEGVYRDLFRLQHPEATVRLIQEASTRPVAAV
jgi:subfamily B ATP-binding cassette protein MsbA